MENLDFVALDLETATFQRSSICEIGIAIVYNSKIIETKSWLIRPKYNIYDGFNISVHGITPEMTETSSSFIEAWPEISHYLEGKLIIAHNTAFDMYALRDALDEAGLPYPNMKHMCSLRLARQVFEATSYGIEPLSIMLDIDMGTHHRAGDDACTCAKIFMKAIESAGIPLNKLQENYGCGEFISSSHTFIPQRKGYGFNFRKQVNLKENIPSPSSINKENIFVGKSICITGTLTCGIRPEILNYIEEIGGIPSNSVTKNTNFLIVGMQDYRVVGDSGMSSKQKKAADLRDKGQNIEILSEKEFIELLNEFII